MNFKDAILQLENGFKVTREQWVGSIYFILESENVKSYQPRVDRFGYDENIMISNNWFVDGLEGEFMFYDIIQYLLDGKKARQRDWPEEKYIFYGATDKALLLHSNVEFPYLPDFESFNATDWVTVT